ncbi:hypothetical protein CEXT_504081 [Caerostris extrusa]|uniref:Uncharacterized protein n=1 Tax=Caerostris extrusa TaxID=172846 RepID=A0AAV4YDR5_CAEEX|nr:hypothetical protein CEXT_504081 [Caerostris extrusa]
MVGLTFYRKGNFYFDGNPFHPKLQPTSPERSQGNIFLILFPCEPLNRKTLRFAVRLLCHYWLSRQSKRICFGYSGSEIIRTLKCKWQTQTNEISGATANITPFSYL